jgi:hypothetical protein
MAISCLISGVEYRITNKYSIREQAGQTSSSSIDVLAGNKPVPVSHQKVQLFEDAVLFFAGFIISVDSPVYSSVYKDNIYNLQVVNMEAILSRRLVSGAWKNKLTHEIVRSIYDEYLQEEGLTLGTIAEFDRLYLSYVVPRLKASDVMQELGDEIGAIANVSASGVFSFVSRGDFPVVAVPDQITNIKQSENGQTLRSVQILSGAKAETSTLTRGFVWIADQADAVLGYQVAEEPAATINGTPATFGLIGVNEQDTDKTFLWRYGNNVVIVNANATTKPVAGDIVVFVFKGFYSIEVLVENETLKNEIAMMSGTSGKIESVVVDTSVTRQEDGEETANGLLREYGGREETITLDCHDVIASKTLNQWYLNYPELNIVGDYVIVERTITDLYDKKKVSLKLKNKGFYSRYGQVYNKNNRQINNLSVRSDDLVIKQSSFTEQTTTTDTWIIQPATLQYYPGDGTDLCDPVALELGGFHPTMGEL